MSYSKLKLLISALALAGTVVSINAQMAQDPLLSRTSSVHPNLVFMFDNSASMPAEFIYQYGGTSGVFGMSGPTPTTYSGKSPDANLIYYDPRVTYSRRINADGTFQPAGNASAVSSFNVYFHKPATSTEYSVSSVSVANKGRGYAASGVTGTFTTAPSAGTTATGTVTVSSSLTAGSVNITANGSGYPNSGTTATFSAPPAGGTTATGTVTVSPRFTVASVTMSNTGTGYPVVGTTATFSPPPTGVTATGTVVVSTGVQSVSIVNPGSGYGSSVTVTFSAPPLGGTTATGTFTRRPNTAPNARGAASITITNPGSGYITPPLITLGNTSGGSGAVLQANIKGITSVNITNPGSGYTSAPTVTFAGLGGSGAAGTVNTNSTNVVTAVNITNPGAGYASAPSVTIAGTGGSGAAGTVVTGTTNVISGFTVTNPGAKYSSPPTITLSGTGGGTGATFVVNTTSVSTPSVNRKWNGTGSITLLADYFNPSYLPDAGSPLAAGANATLVYPNSASSSTASYPRFQNRTDCDATLCTWAQEQQNYANWNLYHKNRLDLAKTGIGLAFQPLNPTFRLGWGTINALATTTPTLDKGVRTYDSTVQGEFMTWLYARLGDVGATPNRKALDSVGRYYQRADSGGPWAGSPAGNGAITSAAAEEAGHASCRRSYALLMTDGYYNETFTLTDVDSTSKTVTSSPTTFIYPGNEGPYSDTLGGTGFSNTFADVAMKYWSTDLRPNLTNGVKPITTDPAYWQHLNFYSIGLGLTGTLDATNPATLAGLTGTSSSVPARTIDWPTPTGNSPSSIDDMWHASINGRGKMLNARSADELRSSITQLMGEVSGDPKSQAGVAVSTANLKSGTKKYTPTYTPVSWNGNVIANNLNATTGNEASVAWQIETPVVGTSGETTYSSLIPAAADRNILVGNGATSGTRAIPFKYTDMSTAGLTSRMSGTVNAALIDYLRGDAANEDTSALSGTGIYRARLTRLGDIVNSTPVFVKDTLDLAYENLPSGTPGQSTYRAYVDGVSGTGGKKQRPEGLLFVGANDGMLHAFRDGTRDSSGVELTPGGIETFAYVPYAVLPTLNQLANKAYVHQYYVDGPIVETDAYFTGGTPRWANVVIGTTGGGAGVAPSAGVSPRSALFALDVTSLNSGPTTLNASNVLWEISSSDTNFSELGYVLTEVQTGTTRDGKWVAVVNNGYDSASCQARLFVIEIETGTKVREINTGVGNCSTAKNGLGGVKLVLNGNQQIIGAYAGDLQGNLWKFNLNDTVPTNWGVDLGGSPLYAAGATQPITGTPNIVTLSASSSPSAGYLVTFGSGKFFEVADITNNTQQSVYGVWDALAFGAATIPAGSTLTSSTTLLVSQTIGAATVGVDGNTYYPVSAIPVDYVGQTTPTIIAPRRGWKINLPNTGERLVYPIQVLEGKFIVVETISPSNVSLDPCVTSGTGTGFKYILNGLTGAGPDEAIFDTNGDNKIDSDDLIVAGYKTAADGRDVTLLVDRNASRTRLVSVGAESQSKLIELSCRLRGDCITAPAGRTRQWRQLFMR